MSATTTQETNAVSTTDDFMLPVRFPAQPVGGQPQPSAELDELYRGFDKQSLVPLWTQIEGLMPSVPQSKAQPHLWEWKELIALARASGSLVPVGRGGERRAIALANPSLNGRPYVSSTLWCAIQYLMPGEVAPWHRHTQHAFRFVVEGEGVWTVVNGDEVPMRRGDFLPQGGWNWHAHHNPSSTPMAWIDGLDIPFAYETESTFFDFGDDELEQQRGPERSRSERLWGHPGLAPLSQLGSTAGSPLLAYRWQDTDAALREQLLIEEEGYAVTVEPGHAAVRYTNPTNARDIAPTMRTQMHRIRRGTETAPVRSVGTRVFQVFDGAASVKVGDFSWSATRGDIFVVPSWKSFSVKSEAGASDSDSGALDLFEFSDAPIFEALGQYRTITEG